MINLVKDVSDLTSIPEKIISKLVSTAIYAINDGLSELEDEDYLDVDLGLGVLSIKLEGDTLSYHFTPSEELTSTNKETILNGQNLLENKLERTLSKGNKPLIRIDQTDIIYKNEAGKFRAENRIFRG